MTTARGHLAVMAAGLLSLTTTSAAIAQTVRSGSGGRADAFIGCWRATPVLPDPRMAVTLSGPLICVVPAGPDSIEFATITNGKVVSRNMLDVTGRDAEFTGGGCSGSQSARWSADDRRLYMRSAATCSGGLQRKATGMYALTNSGDWLDIQSVTAGEGATVRILRYHQASSATLPAEIAGALGNRDNATEAARLAAGAAVTTNDVLDVSKSVDPLVAEAWLLERGQPFSLDAGAVVSLAEQGMPGRVLDAMVAVSYPRTFQIAREDGANGGGDALAIVTLDDSVGRQQGYYDPWAYPRYGYRGCDGSPYGYSGYSPYGYYSGSTYGYGGYGACSGYGANGLGSPFFPGYSGYGYRPPLIIYYGNVVPGAGGAPAHVVNGKGYTRDQSSSTSGRRSPSPQPPASTPPSSGGSSSGSGSSGRTAKPRSP